MGDSNDGTIGKLFPYNLLQWQLVLQKVMCNEDQYDGENQLTNLHVFICFKVDSGSGFIQD
ncbi:hypothetical protein RvY_06253 [Ramazzottius varieornatus]|uniref:Uncharacterized protein n=1 Tax=Ramazzottius varieornatus TaxID=947166 RepID=A0A1D1UXW6_RAMVA|nr:hypothetical protein RvY_06253 [Ramazzottius varieornatus]